MTTNNKSAQQTLNDRAREIGAKIELFIGWKITDKDDNVFLVKTNPQLYALIENLEKGEKAND